MAFFFSFKSMSCSHKNDNSPRAGSVDYPFLDPRYAWHAQVSHGTRENERGARGRPGLQRDSITESGTLFSVRKMGLINNKHLTGLRERSLK